MNMSNIIMHNSGFFSLIFFLFFPILHKSQTLKISSFNCLLIYNRLADNSISFDHCEAIDKSPSNNLYQQSWKECVTSCCRLSYQAYPTLNENSLAECQNNNNIVQQTNIVVTIVIIVMSTIVGIFLIIIVLKGVLRKCTGGRVEPEYLQNHLNETTDINKPIWHDCSSQNTHMTQHNLTYQYQKECPICLEQNTNVVTTCKHSFHINCLLKWFGKNKNCPLCKRSKIHSLRLYCKACYNKYILLSVNRTVKDFQKWLDFVNICDSCNSSPKVRGRASTRDTSFGKLNCSKVLDDIEVIEL